MSWSEDQIDRFRDRMALARRQGAWVSAVEVGIVLGLIRFWRRATRATGPAEGPLPTIGSCRLEGITHIFVDCARIGCGNRRRLSFDELGLSDAHVFVEIAKCGRLRCHRCGSREVTVSVEWPRAKMGLG